MTTVLMRETLPSRQGILDKDKKYDLFDDLAEELIAAGKAELVGVAPAAYFGVIEE